MFITYQLTALESFEEFLKVLLCQGTFCQGNVGVRGKGFP